MLQLAVCDDERVFRSDLRKILGTELELCGIDYHISEFTSGEELIAGLEKADCQILFLDIEMKGIDGVEAARRLRETKRQMEIVFVTSYADFVFQGYEVRALNYILKPYEPEKIAAVLHTALEALDIEAEKYYVIDQRGGSIRVPLSSVKYFSSDRRTVHAVTTEQEYTFYEKLSDLETELPDTFVRIHNRYLVHLKYLDAVRQNTAVVDGEELPVSRSCKSGLSIAFAKYMLH
ncbi:MAG TPA: LytTR family DNA-binding domain-containing protein [Candidatus Mediterraneibacter faecigallinarum]|uniref:Stage 0 sporulation protein A homolog n=1 Tax=Candidatus Mediterraneibacter faecigallinarum TaxID=2838669 RepID=A0A9D2SZJ6_9FIRM|nr:LytTR family DNA-binding domain-containing protein [Candidatus Mediterraneibacter faecigallinarum]